ncbi:MAG: hypothetical protein IH983_06300 [Planctomycetes bacterium]|nr:hypothetical protein [Planctomycetota bacterium]
MAIPKNFEMQGIVTCPGYAVCTTNDRPPRDDQINSGGCFGVPQRNKVASITR